MCARRAKPDFLSVRELLGFDNTHLGAALDDGGQKLHPEAATAFQAMQAAGQQAGLRLKVVSAYRSFEQQRLIWNAKYHGQRPLLDRLCRPLAAMDLSPAERVSAILNWSALPGASRHHWGTDFDLIDAAALIGGARYELIPAEFAAGGPFHALDRWLGEHAAEFGFFRPYDIDRGGVQPEPWHLSFAPLSTPALQTLTPALLAGALTDADLAGKECVLRQLSELHARYVMAVAEAPAAANRASTPA